MLLYSLQITATTFPALARLRPKPEETIQQEPAAPRTPEELTASAAAYLLHLEAMCTGAPDPFDQPEPRTATATQPEPQPTASEQATESGVPHSCASESGSRARGLGSLGWVSSRMSGEMNWKTWTGRKLSPSSRPA